MAVTAWLSYYGNVHVYGQHFIVGIQLKEPEINNNNIGACLNMTKIFLT